MLKQTKVLARAIAIALLLIGVQSLLVLPQSNPNVVLAEDTTPPPPADAADSPFGEVNLDGEGTDCAGTNITVDVNCTDNDNAVLAYIGGISNFLAAGIGIILVLALILSGIQYITSQDNPQQVSAAKNHIWNVVIALMAYIFMFAFLQWLIPGGIFE